MESRAPVACVSAKTASTSKLTPSAQAQHGGDSPFFSMKSFVLILTCSFFMTGAAVASHLPNIDYSSMFFQTVTVQSRRLLPSTLATPCTAYSLQTSSAGVSICNAAGSAWVSVSPATGLGTTSTPTFGGLTLQGAADSGSILGIKGLTKGMRFGTTTSGSVIQGVDSTLNASYQPLDLHGSTFSFGVNGTSYFAMTSSTLSRWDSSHVVSWGSSGTSSPDVGISRNAAGVLEVNSSTAGTLRDFKMRTLNSATKTPASASATGVAGDWAWDSSYIYICTATNTWKRVAVATW
jgi:hypothetical protein